MREIQGKSVAACADCCHACGGQRELAWRAECDKKLGLILDRVAELHNAVHSAAGGVASMEGELKAIGRNLREGSKSRTPINTDDDGSPRRNITTSNHSDWRQCLSQSNECDMVEVAGTPKCPQMKTTPPPAEVYGTEARRPIIVDLENTPDPIVDRSATAEPRTRTPESLAKRVHSQPRLRVVPCSNRMLGVACTEETEKGNAVASPSQTLYQPRYKDPPGYERARDFGTGEPMYKPPLLQPKTHGVSPQEPRSATSNASHVVLVCFCV